MKTIPMIFNQQMVEALVDGRKTVTRRPLKVKPKIDNCGNFIVGDCNYGQDINGNSQTKAFTYFHGPCRPDDLIWVRETFSQFNSSDECGCSDSPCGCPNNGAYIYKANGDDSESKWKPSIHMPRKASRLTLRVTDVRCEKVQQVTDYGAAKEGFSLSYKPSSSLSPLNRFKEVWNNIYKNWDENPWVWVIEFEAIHKNVDEVAA